MSTSPTTVFAEPGIFFRNPRGGDNDFAKIKDAGFHWAAWNEQDFPVAAGHWELHHGRARALGMPFFPWMMVLTNEDVDHVASVGRRDGGGRCIVNAEQALTLGHVNTMRIDVVTRDLDAALCVLPTPDWTTDFTPVLRMPVQVGLFPQENDTSTRPRDCRALWYAEGFLRVNFMHGIHDLDPIRLPYRHAGYAVYTADDTGGDYARYAPTVLAPLDVPYVGPGYAPGNPANKPPSSKSPYWKGLKMALHRAGYGDFGNPDYIFNVALSRALRRMQHEHGLWASGQYGQGSHRLLTTLPAALTAVQAGTWPYAVSTEALKLMGEA